MEINYDEIRRIYRLEKNTAKLSEVSEDFYISLADYLKKSKQEYLSKLDDLSSKDTKKFLNTKKMIEEIFLLRMRKIINKALLFVLTDDEQHLNLSMEERKLFKDLVNILKKHKSLEKQIFNGDASSNKNLVSLEILTDVPAFIGSDMQEYGPYKKNEKIKVDSKVAAILLERKLAKQV